MKKTRHGLKFFAAIACVATAGVMFPLVTSAADITWQGGGNSLAWSDGSNWEGGKAPGEGDNISIPVGAEAVATTAADIALMNGLSSIDVSSGATLCISNLGETATMTVPLTGEGRFYVCNAPDNTTYYYLTLQSDNSAFTGNFAVTNAGLKADSVNCFGGRNGGPISVYLQNKQRFFLNTKCTYYNRLTIGASNATAIFIAGIYDTVWAGDIVFADRVQVNGNNQCFRLSGSVTRAANCGVTFVDGVFLDGAIDLDATYTQYVYMQGTVTLGGGGGNIMSLGRCFAKGTLKCAATNVFAESYGYWLYLGNADNCVFDLAGYDQRVERLGQQRSYTQLTSEKPATLKILNCMRQDSAPWYTWNGDGVDSIGGQVSLDLESNASNVATGQANLTNMNCTTTGGLSCGRGTMTVCGNTTFSNLTSLVAYKTGNLVVNTAHVNPENGLDALAVTNTAKITFANSITQKVENAYLATGAQLKIGADGLLKVSHRTYLDGMELKPGIYGKVGGTYPNGMSIPAAYQLSCLTGDGLLETKGPKGIVLSFY